MSNFKWLIIKCLKDLGSTRKLHIGVNYYSHITSSENNLATWEQGIKCANIWNNLCPQRLTHAIWWSLVAYVRSPCSSFPMALWGVGRGSISIFCFSFPLSLDKCRGAGTQKHCIIFKARPANSFFHHCNCLVWPSDFINAFPNNFIMGWNCW